MMPPFVRRCPDCGHLNLSFRFPSVEEGSHVECPACDCRFEPPGDPWLA